MESDMANDDHRIENYDNSKKWYFKVFPENMDDKDLAIVALTIIAIVCILSWKFSTAVTVVSNIVTGIAGIVTGRALGGNAPTGEDVE
jgi:hypothetical protein